MREIPEEMRKKIVETLGRKGAKLPCPRCGCEFFTLVNGYFEQPILSELSVGGLPIGGPTIPSIAVVCRKCGYISQHALGTLGLLPKEKGDNQETDER